MNKRLATSLLFFFIISTSVLAQTPVKKAKLENPFENKGTINNRFIYLYKTSTNYQAYKVISRKGYLALQKNVKDSINSLRKEISSYNTKITEQEAKILTLNAGLDKSSRDLADANTNKNSISFLGIQLLKKNYNLILVLIITTLAIVAGFFIYKFKTSHIVTTEAKNLLADTQQEFETYQKSALERQQILNRKLQDEIIKNRKD
jgi:hypothetical protein